jgi:large subunit ribosomal protein L10
VNRTEKADNITVLKDKLAKAQSLILTDFRGLTVEADTKLRNEFRKEGCEYRVVKNKLLIKAIAGTKMESVGKMLVGPTAIAYSFEDPAAPAKIAARIAKGEQKFIIKGGYVDGAALDKKGVEALSALPGRDELRATFLATLLAVPQNFLRLTTAAQQNFLYLVAAREADMGKGEAEGEKK